MTKKRNYKQIVVLAATVMLLCVSACGCAGKAPGKDAAKTQTSGEETAGTETAREETAGEKTTASAKESETEIEPTEKMGTGVADTTVFAGGEPVKMMTGTVLDAGMSTVTLKSESYPDGITFLKEDATTGFAEGLLVDREITVFYRGDLEGTDTSGVTVELLRDRRDGDEDREAALITGEVTGVGMSAIQIRTKDGREMNFLQDPKPVNLTEGPVEGEKIAVLYSFLKGQQTEETLTPELLVKGGE